VPRSAGFGDGRWNCEEDNLTSQISRVILIFIRELLAIQNRFYVVLPFRKMMTSFAGVMRIFLFEFYRFRLRDTV